MGGFGKAKGDYPGRHDGQPVSIGHVLTLTLDPSPDPYHSYLALAALAMNEHDVHEHDAKNVSPEMAETADVDPRALAQTVPPVKRSQFPSLGLKALDPQWNVAMDTREYIEGCLGDIFTAKYADRGA